MDMTSFLRTALLRHAFRNTAYTPPATVYVALYTDVGAGTEVTGGSYARQAIAFDDVVSDLIDNTSLITFPTASANWGTIRSIALCDASTAGNKMMQKDLTDPVVINTNGIFKFPAGNVVVGFL